MPFCLRSLLRRFAEDCRGSVSVEFLLMVPLLFWTYMACYVYFDGFRQSDLNLKAAYAIADMISRETTAVNPDYIDSMEKVLRLMTRAETPLKLRVTVVRWDGTDNRYYVYWSENRGYDAPRTDADMAALASRLPVMPDGEYVILIETKVSYEPPFDVGIKTTDLDNFVFTRPRFGPKVDWSAS